VHNGDELSVQLFVEGLATSVLRLLSARRKSSGNQAAFKDFANISAEQNNDSWQ
jgi:hypothetical protein